MREFEGDPASWLDRLQDVLRTYTRAFLAQGVGVIGLLWCLFDRHPRLGLVLTCLVLLDQAVFLRGRLAQRRRATPLEVGLDLWCLGVSLGDGLLLGAIGFQETGLRTGMGEGVTEPLDFLAFATASFFHLGSDLAAVTTAGRFLAIASALGGWAALIGLGLALLRWRRG